MPLHPVGENKPHVTHGYVSYTYDAQVIGQKQVGARGNEKTKENGR